MNARWVHSDIFASESFHALSLAGRLLWIGLVVLADDHGRGRASPRYLQGRIFPGDRGVTVKKIVDSLWQIHDAKNGQMANIYSDQGTDYYEITNWVRYQPMKFRKNSLIPKSNDSSKIANIFQGRKILAATVGIGIGVGVGIGVGIGYGETPVARSYPPGFARFWSQTTCLFGFARGSKSKAAEEWHKLGLESRVDELVHVYQAQVKSKQQIREDGGKADRFPHLYRWIRDGYWEDDPDGTPSRETERDPAAAEADRAEYRKLVAGRQGRQRGMGDRDGGGG